MAQAYGYLRKSSVRDLATETSVETQEREVRALAARHGDESIAIKADWDISGAGQYTKRRTGYLELREAIETGRCSAVYSYSLSRLGRSVHELSALFDLCAGLNVPLRLVVDSVDTSTASGRLLANVLASVAQFESEVASERQNARNLTKRLAGESLRTRRRYGEKEGEDPDAVLEAFSATGSYGGAARLLNAKGVPSRDGKKWWGSSVRWVVQRLDTTIVPPGRARKTGVKFELARLLICPTCGKYLTGSNGSRHNGSRRYYKCSATERMPHPRTSVYEKHVLPWVRERMTGYVLPGRAVDNSVKRREIDEKRSRMADLYADGLIDRTELAKRVAPLIRELQAIDATESAPETIDWEAEPSVINHQLRKLIAGISLNPDFTPRALLRHPGIVTVRWRTSHLTPEESIEEDIAEEANGREFRRIYP